MLKVAVTGNIGSGKSTVVKIFKSLNVPVFIADEEAKKLYTTPGVTAKVKHYFGEDIYRTDGKLNKEKLAELIFNDKEALQTINRIIHPETFKKYQLWHETHKDKAYTIHESAILFENNLQGHFDKIINVSAPADIRLKRVTERDGIPKEAVLERMKNQFSDKEKNKLADFILINDGTTFLIPQIIKINKKLKIL